MQDDNIFTLSSHFNALILVGVSADLDETRGLQMKMRVRSP
jgi:hypothetical protein